MMRIGLDCDDVLADYIGTLAETYNERFGTAYRTEQLMPDLETVAAVLGEQGMRNLFSMFQDKEYVLGIPPVQGAVEGVRELASLGLELYVITSRVSTPAEWNQQYLEEQFGSATFSAVLYGGMVNGAPSKGELCLQYEIPLCVEDHPKNALELQDKGVKVLLLDQRWNWGVEETSLLTRVYDWEGVVREVKEWVRAL